MATLQKCRKKAFLHDTLQTYGKDWVRFDQNEKNVT